MVAFDIFLLLEKWTRTVDLNYLVRSADAHTHKNFKALSKEELDAYLDFLSDDKIYS